MSEVHPIFWPEIRLIKATLVLHPKNWTDLMQERILKLKGQTCQRVTMVLNLLRFVFLIESLSGCYRAYALPLRKPEKSLGSLDLLWYGLMHGKNCPVVVLVASLSPLSLG